MAKATFTISGIPEVGRAFDVLGKRVGGKVVRQAVRAALKPLQAEIVRRAPRDTGTLAKDVKIRARPRRKRGVIAIDVQTGKGKGFYAGKVEYGTSKQRAQPFIRPAFDARKATVASTVRDLIRAGIEREAKAL